MSKIGQRNWPTQLAWIEQALKQIPASSRILDAGAGQQKYKGLCSHLNYVAQDFARYDGKGDGTGMQDGSWDQTDLDIVSDITSIPEPDGSFDAIMCTEVFEHLPNPIAAIKEFARLLKPGGQLILTAPFCSFTHQAPYHFYSGFNRYFYQTHLTAYGFDIVDIQANGTFFEYIAQGIRYIPNVARRYSQSKPRIWESLAIKVVLTMLERFDAKDRGSCEFATHGYFIRAIKR